MPNHPESTVLIVEPDVGYSNKLQQLFADNGLNVDVEADEAFAIRRIADEQPDLVVLGMNAQGEPGLTICRLSRRAFSGGIMLLGQQADELDQVLGLDMGADDYLLKSMSDRLMLARVSALLRRVVKPNEPEPTDDDNRLTFGDLVIDHHMREAFLKGHLVDLTSAEFDLLWLLASHAGEVLSREAIFRELRGIEYDGQDRSVDVRVSRIRPKVGDDPIHPRRIKTIRSKGYLFVKEIPAEP